MTEKEFRTSEYQKALAVFLDSPAGKALLDVLDHYSRPFKGSSEVHGTFEDVQFQMSVNLVASMEKYAMLDFIKKLSYEGKPLATPRFEPLEDEDDSGNKTKKISHV
jgi:hypothetical protein